MVALLLALPAPVVHAQDSSVSLAGGTWLGTMGAGGVLTGSQDGASATWIGWVDGSFAFEVAGGSASGDWDWLGDADLRIETSEGPFEMSMQSVASGPLSGSSSRVTLTGEQSTTGQGTVMGVTVDVGPIPNPVDPIEVVFVDASCNVAFGDWTTSLNEMAGEGGFAGSLQGFFVATNLDPSADEQLTAELLADFEEHHDRTLEVASELASGLSAGVLLDLVDLIEEGVELEARADRLERTCAFDQVDGGPFATSLTSLLASVLQAVVHQLDPYELFSATQLLLSVGAIGDGASSVLADLVEPLLRDRAQALVDEAVTLTGSHPDQRPCSPVEPCVLFDRGLVHVFIAADMLGITLTVDRLPIDYSTIAAAQR